MSVKCFSLHGVLYVCIKIRPQEAEKRHDKESNAYIQDNNIDPVCESHVLFRMGYPPDILFDSDADEEDIRRYYKTGAFTAGNGSGVEGSEYHLRGHNKRRGGSAAAGILFIYFAGLAVGIVCYISSALTQKQREKILAEKNDEE